MGQVSPRIHDESFLCSIYSNSVLYDSGMTEGRDASAVDLYFRQAIVSGDRVPFLVGYGAVDTLIYYHNNADADVGHFGDGSKYIAECTDEVQCETVPWAAQYLKCSQEALPLCSANRFHANCWVERDDVTPKTPQDPKPGSQVSWHPGNRWHQIIGRGMAFTVMRALKAALVQWQQTGMFSSVDSCDHLFRPNTSEQTITFYPTILGT
jgi:hypothetical protein